mmetsp:Transcript_45866/g.147287  ORF Transcript_45866/g.147287 Transcript_45866/m.147287 type:complete len:336 (-) Transcript_45866:372-1379(-)
MDVVVSFGFLWAPWPTNQQQHRKQYFQQPPAEQVKEWSGGLEDVALALSESADALLAVLAAQMGAEHCHPNIKVHIGDTQECSARLEASMLRVLELLDVSKGSEQHAVREVVQSLLNLDVPSKLVSSLPTLDFEARKSAARIFCLLLRMAARRDSPGDKRCGLKVVNYIRQRRDLIEALLDGCADPEVFFHCAELVQSCARCGELARELFASRAVPRLLELAQHQNFDISSEAFGTLRQVLLAQKDVAAEYVAVDGFLQIHMNLLRNDSVPVQLNAFHVFKIFVANPNRPRRVEQILCKNRDRLVRLLTSFASKQTDDAAFSGDIQAVLEILEAM